MGSIPKLLIAVAVPVLVGLAGGFLSFREISGWYAKLKKPSWNPPNALFAPVWTSLYVLMGISLWLVWKEPVAWPLQQTAFAIFAVQLILNFFWSFIFFRNHQTGWAFVEVVLLWFSIVLTIFAFARVSAAAAWLLLPYISWVSFASFLNFKIWQLNERKN